MFDKRRLARAVRPDNRHAFAATNLEAHVADRCNSGGIGVTQVFNLNVGLSSERRARMHT